MLIRNTREDFGVVHKTMHWATALLMLALYIVIYWTNETFVRATPAWRGWLHVHQIMGYAVLFLAIAQLIWRRTSVRPQTVHANRLEHWAATAAHFALYTLLITMPLTGYAGGDRDRNYFGVVFVPTFKNSEAFAWISATFGITWKQWDVAMDFYHRSLMDTGLLILVALHVFAALLHHFHRRDRVLVRMLPGRFRARRPEGEVESKPGSAH